MLYFRKRTALIMSPILFFDWWYREMGIHVFRVVFSLIFSLEDKISIVFMAKQIVTLQPLHQDYSLVGRFLGVVIRLLWIVMGIPLLLVFAIPIISLYLFYLSIPVIAFGGFVYSLLQMGGA